MALADRVTIYNMVRLLLEDGDVIQDVGEKDTLAEFISVIYEDARDQLFELHPWRFCSRLTDIAAYSEAPAFRWDYQYQVPSDFIKMRHLTKDGDLNGTDIPYEMGIIDTGSGSDITQTRVIMCNEAAPLYLQYTCRIENERLFSPLFVSALAAYLALMFCHSQTGKQSYVERIERIYTRAFAAAVASDGSQGTREQPITQHGMATPNWIGERQI